MFAAKGHWVDEKPEDRLEREAAPTDLIKRALIGALGCAILGFLYFGVWALAFGLNWHAALAALAASAVFGSIVGVAGVWVAPNRFKEALLGCFAGGVAGVVWWLIAQPGTSTGSIALAVGVSALLGALFALFG